MYCCGACSGLGVWRALRTCVGATRGRRARLPRHTVAGVSAHQLRFCAHRCHRAFAVQAAPATTRPSPTHHPHASAPWLPPPPTVSPSLPYFPLALAAAFPSATFRLLPALPPPSAACVRVAVSATVVANVNNFTYYDGARLHGFGRLRAVGSVCVGGPPDRPHPPPYRGGGRVARSPWPVTRHGGGRGGAPPLIGPSFDARGGHGPGRDALRRCGGGGRP